MTIQFPRTDIIDGLKIVDGALQPMWRHDYSASPARTIVKDLAPMLWRATYRTAPMSHDEAAEIEADLLTLQGGVKLFEGYDPRRPLPLDNAEDALDGVTVFVISPDRLRLRLTGVPVGFKMTKGDYVSIDDGTNLFLIRAATTAPIANAAGESGWFDIAPALHPSITVGMPVTLRFPCARFMLDPGGVSRQATGIFEETISISATQVIE
ncbi:hypothetical protein ACSQ76_12245 [Roseovarius sp. B08]|uniref:hypothetical protein n=1 Tax=Roseovarius sp. B08 TaxID=3449223 RepID=UPI003EDBC4FB